MKARISGLAFAALFSTLAMQNIAGAQSVLAPRGTEIDGMLTQTLSSKTAHEGDAFTLSAANTWFHKNPFPTGSMIEGHVEGVAPASPTHKAAMRIVIDDVRLPSGDTVPLHARVESLKELEPHKHLLRDTGVVVGSAFVGHVLAKRTGHKGGTLAGAATGFALVSTMKSDIVVRKGTLLRLKAEDDVSG